ncbi:MAG: lysophospholipid acyltransferase family protein [Pseudomonadota bacterium]
MPSTPKLHRRTPWVYFRSVLQWFIGGIAMCIATLLVFTIGIVVPPYRLDPFLKIFCHVVIWISGIRITVHGLEKLDPKKAYLFIFNHINIFDHFVMYASMPHRLRGVEKEVHFRWPVYGWFIRRIGQVSIPPRGDTTRALQSLDRAKKVIEDGISVAMAPEGTRSRDGELQPFKKGAFHLAIQMNATIVPLILVGMYKINRKKDWLIYPGPIDVYFEDPIEVSKIPEPDPRRLSEQVRSIFVQRLYGDAGQNPVAAQGRK